MTRYTKKPVTIEAVHYLGNSGLGGLPMFESDEHGPPSWLSEALDKDPHEPGAVVPNVNGTLFVMTLEGILIAAAGDWIIRGVEGELYPCKNSIFEVTYALAED